LPTHRLEAQILELNGVTVLRINIFTRDSGKCHNYPMKFALYGLPQLAIGAVVVFFRLYLLIYLTQIVKFSGNNAALIMSSALILSAIFDPFIGKFSDHYKATRGKLTPLILIGIFLMCVSVSNLLIPIWSDKHTLIVFLLVLSYEFSYSFFLIPYLALAKELTVNRNDIVNLYSWRYFWGSFGAIVGVALPFLQKFYVTSAYTPMAIVMVGLLILLCPLPIFWLKEKHKHSHLIKAEKNVHIKTELKILFKNRAFLGYFLAFTFLSIGLGLNQTLAVYYYKHGLHLDDQQTNTVFTIYMLIFCLAIPLTSRYAKSAGKINTLRIGLSLSALGVFCYPFIPSENLGYLYALTIFIGISTSVVVLIDAYLSNIIDLHNYYRKSKHNNFAFGVWRITDKLSRAFGIYLAGLAVDYTIKEQNFMFNIKEVFGFGVFILFFVAAVFLYSLRFSENMHKKLNFILSKKYPHLCSNQLESS